MYNKRKHSGKSAFTILEVVLSLVILLFMGIMVTAVLPITLGMTRTTSDFNHAASLVQHKINQLQDAGYTSLTGPSLGQSGLRIVDGTPATPATNATGSATATFEFTDCDRIWQYFSGGMDETGNQVVNATSPRGYLYLAPYAPSAYVNAAGVTEYGLVRATITVQWWTSKGKPQSFSATTLIPRVNVN
jgi:type II secretory pathway pseudopilin PulG